MSQLASGVITAASPISAFAAVPLGPLSVQVTGATESNQVAVVRSLDGGVTFAPVAVGAYPSPAILSSSLSLDLSEARNGAMYAFQVLNPSSLPPGASIGFQIWQ